MSGPTDQAAHARRAEAGSAPVQGWVRWFEGGSGSRLQLLKGNDDSLALLVPLDLDKSPLHIGPLGESNQLI